MSCNLCEKGIFYKMNKKLQPIDTFHFPSIMLENDIKLDYYISAVEINAELCNATITYQKKTTTKLCICYAFHKFAVGNFYGNLKKPGSFLMMTNCVIE